MISDFNLPFRQTFLQASAPLFLYSVIRFIETTLQYDSCSLLQSSKDFLLGLYSNYPLFMLAMLILNVLIPVLKRPGLSKEASPIEKGNKTIPRVIRTCLCFTLIYACVQLITSSLPQQELSENLSLNTTINGLKEVPRRILEGEKDGEAYLMRDTLPKEEEDTELFEVGKIIGSRPIERSAIAISKDGQTIFLSGEERGVLRIIDISDPQNPKMLSTFALNATPSPERFLLLSANEKILYTSCGVLLEIVDVSNLKSPVLLSAWVDFDMMDLHDKTDFSFVHTSMALSWNEKALYVGGCGLQIFSVEDPKQPQPISSFAEPGPNQTLFVTSVATSADRKTLYFVNGTVEVYDISLSPEEPVLKSTLKMGTQINSMILGKDNKTLYAAGRTENGKMILEKIAIEENSPFLKNIETFSLGISSASPPSILEKSLSESTFFLFTTQDVKDTFSNSTSRQPAFRAYNLVTREILSNSKDLFPSTSGTLRVIPNTKNFVISKENQLNIVSFFSSYPNSYSFGVSNNTIGIYKPPQGAFLCAVPSAMGIDRLYTITSLPEKYNFNIIDMSNKDDPEILASFPLDIQADTLHLIESANRAFAIDENNAIQILDFSDLSKIQSLVLTQIESFEKKHFYPLTLSRSAENKNISLIQCDLHTWQEVIDLFFFFFF